MKPDLVLPPIAPADDVGEAMLRIFNYIISNTEVPSDHDLIHLPQVITELSLRRGGLKSLNFNQRHRLNTLRNRYPHINQNNQGVGFGRRRSHRKSSSKRKSKSKKSSKRKSKRKSKSRKSLKRK